MIFNKNTNEIGIKDIQEIVNLQRFKFKFEEQNLAQNAIQTIKNYVNGQVEKEAYICKFYRSIGINTGQGKFLLIPDKSIINCTNNDEIIK